jgi:hypothetical protein
LVGPVSFTVSPPSVSVKEEAREVEGGITVPDAKNRVKEEEVVVV